MFDFASMNYRIKPFISTELNDLRKIICLRKFDVSIERISDCENVAEHGIHCLPCAYAK